MLASGKLDRAALPDPASQAASDAAYVAPRDADEESIAAIWAEVLGLERVSIEDDFFALGGHSLLGTQVLVRIRKTFGVDVPMYAMFTAPTVASLAGEVRALRGEFADVDEELLAELAAMSDDEARELLGELGAQDSVPGDNDEATGDA
ncbi:MAG: phosphopantetheine-binding protein [Acidothermaceae bacterium]